MLLGLRAEPQAVDEVDYVPQVVPALEAILDLAEDLTDLVFDGVRAAGSFPEAAEIGKEITVDELPKVIAG